jgi:hypothetical protein
MRLPGRIYPRLFQLCLLPLLLAQGLPARGEEKLLSPAELTALDRQNRMWRMVRADQDVAANLQAWRKAGFSVKEVEELRLRLTELWTVQLDRNFGWLRPETVEKIQALDQEFIPRLRAARLYAAIGIRVGAEKTGTVVAVDQQWRRAILRLLDYDELAEFRLTNSIAARDLSRLLEGITLTTGEERRLFQLERDFRNAYERVPAGAPRAQDPGEREAWLDHLAAMREELGNERFAVYLRRANAEFEAMDAALGRLTETRPGAALDFWWLRQKLVSQYGKGGAASSREWQGVVADTRAQAQEMLGNQALADYLTSDNARWLRGR